MVQQANFLTQSDDWVFSPHEELDAVMARLLRDFPPRFSGSSDSARQTLEKLGNLQNNLPPVFHVAGTNGKGSVLAFLQAILEAGGKTVHKFTSPHMIRVEERFVLNGKNVNSETLKDVVLECMVAATGTEISYFELLTVAMFVMASRVSADVLLLETGVGGEHDVTNFIPDSVAMITRISYDHMRLLGDTLPEIARQKAGIMREGSPCIVAPQIGDGVLGAIEKHARKICPLLYCSGKDWAVREEGAGFVYKSSSLQVALPLPALAGAHQLVNAGTAIAAIEKSNFSALLQTEILEMAMQQVTWAGRSQRLEIDILPEGWELWLDGAHNDSAVEVILQQIQKWGGDKPVHLVTAAKSGKTVTFFKEFQPYVESVTVLDAPFTAPMMPADELYGYLKSDGFKNLSKVNDLETIVQRLSFQNDSPGRILVIGSLYLVGHVLRHYPPSTE